MAVQLPGVRMLHIPVPVRRSVSPMRTWAFSSWLTVVASMVCAPFSHDRVNLNGIFSGTLAHSMITTTRAPAAIIALRSQYCSGKFFTSS